MNIEQNRKLFLAPTGKQGEGAVSILEIRFFFPHREWNSSNTTNLYRSGTISQGKLQSVTAEGFIDGSRYNVYTSLKSKFQQNGALGEQEGKELHTDLGRIFRKNLFVSFERQDYVPDQWNDISSKNLNKRHFSLDEIHTTTSMADQEH